MPDAFAAPGIRYQYGQHGQDGHVHLSGPGQKLSQKSFSRLDK
jgi:hypothetical protein